MAHFPGEVIGTMLLILLGDGVVANVVLKKTKGSSGGWIVITFGWAMAVFVGVYCVAAISGAQLNPAVTIGLALAGKFGWGQVPLYILSQMVGAALGAFLVWLQYRQHFDITEDRNLKLAVFCTAPEIRSYFYNARDFAPRLMHAILPIKDKRDSDWSYSWIPILGPICGAAVAAVSYRFLR